jgi:hypothetical protein
MADKGQLCEIWSLLHRSASKRQKISQSPSTHFHWAVLADATLSHAILSFTGKRWKSESNVSELPSKKDKFSLNLDEFSLLDGITLHKTL